MTVADVAGDHYADRTAVIRAAVAASLVRWREAAGRAVDMAWEQYLPEVMTIVSGAQLSVARRADRYVGAALSEQGVAVAPAGVVVGDRLAGVASDGRTLDGLLRQPATVAAQALRQGVAVDRALAGGQAALDMIVQTQVADAGRVADGLAITARDGVGYVRMLTPPSCSRCAVLAGRWYRWNAGFDRHPRCNCTQIPAREDAAGDLRTDPRAYFRSLSEADQDHIFTKAGARAIRDGADIGQVVNARRGMRTADHFGRSVRTTLEGTTRRGLAGQRLLEERARLGGTQQIPRLMPESIYKLAEDRADAVRLLRRFGYII